MPLPSDITFDPMPPAEGTKFSPDETYNFDPNLRLYTHWSIISNDKERRILSAANVLETDILGRTRPDIQMYLIHRSETHEGLNTDTIKDNPYLDYDFTYSTEPVNQWPFINKWKPFVARAAHHFDWTIGAKSLESLNENQIWTVRTQTEGLVGSSWFILNFLETSDPLAKDRQDNFIWKADQADAALIVEGLCHECEGFTDVNAPSPVTATFTRRFAHKANLALFRGALISGKVHGTDRTVAPWGLSTVLAEVVVPSGTTPSESDISGFHRENAVSTKEAIEYYDEHIAPYEQLHTHEG